MSGVPTRASIQKALAQEQKQRDAGPPEACKTKRMSYAAFHEFAEQQAAAGERQRLCATCDRWKFPAERCPYYRKGKAG